MGLQLPALPVSRGVEAIMGWFSKFNAWAGRLKPVSRYVFWIAFYTAILLILDLIRRGPHWLRWSDFLLCLMFGAAVAFKSEHRKKHPKPPPPVTRYTNPKLLDENGRYQAP
jgi:hypothetical protein